MLSFFVPGFAGKGNVVILTCSFAKFSAVFLGIPLDLLLSVFECFNGLVQLLASSDLDRYRGLRQLLLSSR